MKIGIYGGIDVGDVINKDIPYIGVDVGGIHLLKYGIQPLCVIGDMDSLSQDDDFHDIPTIKYSSIKDDTDTALALQYAFSKGYDEIDLYGVTQKRIDHFIAILCLLEKYKDKHITVYDQYNKIYILNAGKHIIQKEKYQYFSLFALNESYVSLANCQYPLTDYLLIRDDSLCVSNEMIDDYVVVTTSQSILFIQSQ